MWIAVNAWDAFRTNSQASDVAANVAAQELQYQRITRDFPASPTTGENLKRAVEIAQTLRKGTKALCVISAGFAETGIEGIRRQEQLLARVRAHGARLIGPNCLGIFVARPGLNATFAPHTFPSGNIGFSSQSGASA